VATEGAKISKEELKTAKPVEISPLEIDEKISKFLNSASRFINSLVKAREDPTMVKQVARKLALKTLGLEDVELTIELTDFLRSKKELDPKKIRQASVSFGHYLTKHLPKKCREGKVAKMVNGAVRHVNAYRFECYEMIEALYQEWIKEKGRRYLRETSDGGSDSTERRSL